MIKLNYPNFWSKGGPIPILLTPFSWIYLLLGGLRKIITKELKLPGKVICVGNMTVGGTGKTQIVMHIAEKLKAGGNENFVIITKAYGSSLKDAKLVSTNDDPSEVGDESVLLASYGRVIAAKKIKDALPLLNQLKPQIIITDDGSQNPSFHKDMVILVIDSSRWIGNGKIFPAGPLREYPESAFKKADRIVLVGNKQGSQIDLPDNKPIFWAQIKLTSIHDLTKSYIAFTAIGNPDRFFDLLRASGMMLVKTISFPDHYHYQDSDLESLKKEADAMGCSLITTSKDMVKLHGQKDIETAIVKLVFDKEFVV